MDQPKIPTLKDTQKPQVKVRGMSAGLTLFDRLKSFRKKDLAFILAGLGTLFMAPLAEHFMMAPEGADATLQPGMGNGGKGAGRGIFDGSGSGPYEGGVTGLAPGSAVGGGSDIITPLNVRDPSALVMGPGATQQPPTNSVAPATPPPTAPSTRSDSDLKDALAASARGVGAASSAAKRAAMPVPKVPIGGTGLRGLAGLSGGSSAQAGLGAPNSNGLVSGHAAGSNSLTHSGAAPGYKGVASRGPGSGAGKGIEALKGAANDAGSKMNQGSASSALNDAANTGIPNGGAGFGGNGQGGAAANDKADSGNNDKSSKNTGESLAFMKAKMQMEAEMARKAKRDEANDMGLQMAQWRNKLIEQGLVGPLGEIIGGRLKKMFGPGASGQYVCNGVGTGPAQAIDGSDVGTGACDDKSKYVLMGTDMYLCKGNGLGDKGGSSIMGDKIGTNCYAQGDVPKGGATNPPGANNPQSVNRNGRAQTQPDAPVNNTVAAHPALGAGLDDACTKWKALSEQATTVPVGTTSGPASSAKGAQTGDQTTFLTNMGTALGTLATSRAKLNGKDGACGVVNKNYAEGKDSSNPTVTNYRSMVSANIQSGMQELSKGGVVNKSAADAQNTLGQGASFVAQARKSFTDANTLIDTSVSEAGAVKIPAAGAITDGQYTGLVAAANSAKGEIAKVGQELKAGPQKTLEAVLIRAEATSGAAAKTQGANASQNSGGTAAQVCDVNDKFTAMKKAIADLKNPATPAAGTEADPNAASNKIIADAKLKDKDPLDPKPATAAQAAAAATTEAVNAKIKTANEKIDAVCKQLNNCSGPAPKLDEAKGEAIAQALMAFRDSESHPVTGARQTQSNAFNGIVVDAQKAQAAAPAGSPAAPAAPAADEPNP